MKVLQHGCEPVKRQTAPIGTKLDTLGSRLKAVRVARGLKLGEAARGIGVSRTSFGQWENDSVKNPDMDKLVRFTKLADISLDWLTARRGPDPDLRPAGTSRRGKRAASAKDNDGPSALLPHTVEVPEIAAVMTAHAEQLALEPRAVWSIPEDVLELGFHATPGHVVVKRCATREGSEFGVTRGDYVLIDTSRDRMDEPGIYLLSDPEGRCARRALVKWMGDVLRIVILADDVNREDSTIDERGAVVLGRVMGIFKPV